MMEWNWLVFAAGLIFGAYLLMMSPVLLAVAVSQSGFGFGLGFLVCQGAVRRAQMRAAGIKKKKSGKKRKAPSRSVIIYLIRHVKIDSVFVSGVIAFENAMHTALVSGAVRALSVSFPGKIHNRTYTQFGLTAASIEILGILSAPFGHIMLAAIMMAEMRLKERIKTWKNTRLTD